MTKQELIEKVLKGNGTGADFIELVSKLTYVEDAGSAGDNVKAILKDVDTDKLYKLTYDIAPTFKNYTFKEVELKKVVVEKWVEAGEDVELAISSDEFYNLKEDLRKSRERCNNLIEEKRRKEEDDKWDWERHWC